ncbi:MAG: cob(I)yrinic acid a,c-diamide adenosyltransferase [SAR202 cluster bacterium]|jgi:cob(I)alamin adenosyltransferase|nr:cob(I)yrinic acid a,c-diamide adenosyltransferase [SAR202 cluster bacterium]
MPKLYTKSGDDGTTGLLFGGRISKSDPRTEAYGMIDQAVSAMGLARAFSNNDRVKEILIKVQKDLFSVGSELATDVSNRHHLKTHIGVVTSEMVSNLEKFIDEIHGQIKLPTAFIIPGGSPASAALDLARSTLRTSERRAVTLDEVGKLGNPEVLRYLNRMSDLIFILARFEDKDMPYELTKEN